jgi:hypothetical protein
MKKFGIPSASKHTWVEIMKVWISMIEKREETDVRKKFAKQRLILLAGILDEMENVKKD